MINFIYKKTSDPMEQSQPTLGYSRKKKHTGGLRANLFWTPPWNFSLFLLYLWKFQILNLPVWFFSGIAHLPYPASFVTMLAHFHKMPIQVGQAVKGDMLFLTCTHLGISLKKINIAAVNISKGDQSFVQIASTLLQNNFVFLQFFIPWEFNNQTIKSRR